MSCAEKGLLEIRVEKLQVTNKKLRTALLTAKWRSYYLLSCLLGDPTSHIPKKYRDKFDSEYRNL